MNWFGGFSTHGSIPNYYYDYFSPYGGPVDHRSRSGPQSFSFPSSGDFEGHESLFEIWKRLYRTPVQVCPTSHKSSGRARYPIQTSSSLVPSALRVDPNTGIHFIDRPIGLGFNGYNAIFSQRINVPRGWSKWTRKCVAPLDSPAHAKKIPEDQSEGIQSGSENEGVKEAVDRKPQHRSGETIHETETDDGIPEDLSGVNVHGGEIVDLPETVEGFPVDKSGDSLRRTDSFDLETWMNNFVETNDAPR